MLEFEPPGRRHIFRGLKYEPRTMSWAINFSIKNYAYRSGWYPSYDSCLEGYMRIIKPLYDADPTNHNLRCRMRELTLYWDMLNLDNDVVVECELDGRLTPLLKIND